MPLWTDNFNRANGPLGANWSVKSNVATITNNKASGTYITRAVAGPVSGPGSAMAEALMDVRSSSGLATFLVVKGNSTLDSGFAGLAWGSGSAMSFAIYRLDGGSTIGLTSGTLAGTVPATGTLRLSYSGGTITLFWNGVQQIQASSASYATNALIGVWWQDPSSYLDSFTASGDGSPQMILTPRVVGTDDGDQLIGFMGVAVTYTPGTPGTPALTVNAGALNSQQITSTTNGTFLFSPPATAQTVTVTDSVNGLTATIVVVAGTYLGGGTGGVGGMPSSVVDWLTLQASHAGLILTDADTTEGSVEGTLLKTAFGEVLFGKRTTVGTVDVSPLDPSLLYTLWRLVNGQYGSITGPFPEPSFTTLDAGLGTIDGKLDTLVTGANWNLAELLYSLGGNPVVSHQDIVDALGSLGGSDLTPVLDAIAATRGDTTTSLATLLSSLAGIRTTHTYSLGDVKDWVDALPHGEAGPTALAVVAFIAALALAIPTGGGSIAAEAVAVGAGPLLDIATLVEVVSILGELAGIASSVESIRDSLSPSGALTAPVWPGEANVTLGTPHVLADQLYIVEPMDGVIISVTTAPSKTGLRQIGGALYDYGVGEIAFETDSGHIEMWQYLGFRSMIATPKSMARAAGARFRVLAGASGTVTPWTSS